MVARRFFVTFTCALALLGIAAVAQAQGECAYCDNVWLQDEEEVWMLFHEFDGGPDYYKDCDEDSHYGCHDDKIEGDCYPEHPNCPPPPRA